MNTYWISVLYDSLFTPLLVTRLLQCAVMIPVELVVIVLLVKTLGEFLRKKAMQWA
ncbi:MAG TPA: hypothetical protein VN538_06390 [Clostridia bacterium]|nr:hypothetical protein [Clostridia bacterium]